MNLLKTGIRTEAKFVAAFTIALWSLYFLVRFVINSILGLGNWQPLLMISAGISGTLLTWLIARKLRGLNFILILILGQGLVIFTELISWELSAKLINRAFTWEGEDFVLARYGYDIYWSSFIFFTWYLGYFAIMNYYKFVRESLAAAEARAHANEAQLEMLRYQINPHFLFNTLNSISALVLDKKNGKAEDMIGGLSRFLRFSLDRIPDIKTPLADEIAMIKEYLAIEEIRFSDKLSVHYDIEPGALDCLVPSLILQPAIENAIKHGVGPLKSGGKIIVRAKIVGNRLNFCIIDSGQGLHEQATLGVGMRNMQDRLKVLYGHAGYIVLKNDEELGGANACLEIPVERSSNEEKTS